jgi:hypothetical protein
MTVRLIASTTRYTSDVANWLSARPARRPQSSTARASKRRKAGIHIVPSGFDAGKKINGKKRHVLVDTHGLLLCAIVHAADIQDRDGGVMLMGALFGLFPSLLKLYADSGYQGPKFQEGLRRVYAQINLEIVKRSDIRKFVVLPRGGSSSEQSAGSTGVVGWPRTGNVSTGTASHSYVGHPSALW